MDLGTFERRIGGVFSVGAAGSFAKWRSGDLYQYHTHALSVAWKTRGHFARNHNITSRLNHTALYKRTATWVGDVTVRRRHAAGRS